jgi:flagellar biosynthesis anti-sigma factor FlgM
MNIDRVNISNQCIDRSQTAQSNEAARSAGKDRQSAAGSDSVALSSQANELNRLAHTLELARTNRLDQVRAEIQSGTYQVLSADLAQKLIDSNLK